MSSILDSYVKSLHTVKDVDDALRDAYAELREVSAPIKKEIEQEINRMKVEGRYDDPSRWSDHFRDLVDKYDELYYEYAAPLKARREELVMFLGE